MSFKDCLNEIRRSFDGVLSDDEILEVLEEFDAVSRATAEQRPWANVQQELFGHAERLAKDAREQVLIKRRNQLADSRKATANRAILDQPEWTKDPAAAPVAKVFGALGFNAKGGKASVHRQGVALGRYWIGSLENALEKEGLGRVLAKGALDRQVAMEMWELGRPKGGKSGLSGSKEALQAAKLLHGLQEAMVSRLNRAGAYIKRLPGYIVRQTHDARKISRAGFDSWFTATAPKVDEMRTFNRLLAEDERKRVYQGIWQELAAGRHPSAVQDQGFIAGSGGNLAKRLSQHRELHFKTGSDWFDYHQAFGRGTILEAVAHSAQSNGRAAALLDTFGSRPKQALESFVAEADDRAVKIGAKTSDARNRFSAETLWGVVSGEANRPADATLARLGNGVRSWQIASKMGSAVVSAYLTDPILQGNELARHGVPFMRRAIAPLQDIFRMAADDGQRRELANMTQAYRDGVLSETWGRFDSGDGVPGATSWMARKLMKWSGMNAWTDVHRAGVTAIVSHQMAENSKLPFDKLEPRYRRMMESYGIGAEDWPRVGAALTEVDGQHYVTPHQFRDEHFGALDSAAGRRSARRARDELSTKVMTFIDDRMAAGVLEPGARTKAMLVSDRPGTWRGEAWRSFALFKSFPIEILTRVWGERLAHSEYGTLAALVLTMGVAGVATNVMRDGLRGITTDWSELDPAQMAQVFFRGMATGGGAGIMGDFALGEHNRYGRTFVATQAGPVFGQLDSIAEIYAATVRGEDAGAKAFRALYTNVPFINVWWARTAFDYLLLYTMQEWMNPGYLARMERDKEKETGQKFILAPSTVHG